MYSYYLSTYFIQTFSSTFSNNIVSFYITLSIYLTLLFVLQHNHFLNIFQSKYLRRNVESKKKERKDLHDVFIYLYCIPGEREDKNQFCSIFVLFCICSQKRDPLNSDDYGRNDKAFVGARTSPRGQSVKWLPMFLKEEKDGKVIRFRLELIASVFPVKRRNVRIKTKQISLWSSLVIRWICFPPWPPPLVSQKEAFMGLK